MKRIRIGRIGIVFGLVVAASLVCSVGQAQDEISSLLIASKVYTMTGEPLTQGQVLVVDGKIKAVGKKIELDGATPKIIDLGPDSVLMPGLVDAYSQTALGADGTNEETNEITPQFRTIDSVDWEKPALRRQLLSGTTTMCVCPGTQNVFSGIAAIVKTSAGGGTVLNEDGALVASLCSDPAQQNRARARPDSIYIRQPTNRMGVVWILRKTFTQAKEPQTFGGLAVVEQALEGDRPLMIVSRMANDLNTIATLADEFGFSPVVVGGQESHKVVDMLAERKYPVILQNIGTGAVRGQETSEICWNQAGVLADAGVVFALSGDDLLEQARFAHRHGLAADKALDAITVTPAKLLNIDSRVGSIAAGKDADLIALNGEPLELTTSVRWVMVNGKTIEINKEN